MKRSAVGSNSQAGPLTAGQRVLFVSHEASRTGAPVMFLNFLRWLRINTELDFEVLLLAGGPLVDEFNAIAPVTHVEALGTGARSYLEGGLAKAGFPELGDKLKVMRSRRAVDRLRGFDAVYLNSTTSAIALRILPEIPPVVVSHVHELDAAFRYWFPEAERRAMLTRTTRYVACADAVADNLVERWNVPADKVATHHEFVVPPTPSAGAHARIRNDLGIPPDAAVVGGAGSVIWRKGPDLFLQVAATIRRHRPDLDVHFVWVGGASDERVPTRVDAERMGIVDRVHFVGEVARPDDFYGAYDVFALTSREDPYPLVMLEAAALGVPVVSFANGGSVEFAGSPAASERRAIVVPYLDVEAMADSLIPLLEDEGERRALGRRGQRHVLDAHTVDVAAPALHDELLAALEGRHTTRGWTSSGENRSDRRAPVESARFTSVQPPTDVEPSRSHRDGGALDRGTDEDLDGPARLTSASTATDPFETGTGPDESPMTGRQ